MARKILVVEDSPTQAERVRLLLESEGYEVVLACNGREGLQCVQTAPPDLIISDVVMPEMDGYAFCQAVKAAVATRRLPFVLLTERRTPADILLGLERGADNFITKPFEDDYLLERVRRIVEHLELRQQRGFDIEIAIRVGGCEIPISADKQQIIELLLATFAELQAAHEQVEQSNTKLRHLTLALEDRVTQRTAELHAAYVQLQHELEERKRAEVALRESEDRYRDLFEHANDLIYTLDLAGNFTSINRMGEQTTGYTRDELLRMNLNHLVAPEHLALAYQMLASQRTGTPSTTYELDIVAKGGQRVTLEVSTRLTAKAGKPVEVQGIARNITERQLLEAQLRQAQKMEAIGTLASGIAHDFNNILAAILGYSELTMNNVSHGSRAWQNLGQILAAGLRAKELVQKILLFSRETEQARQPVQLTPLVTEVLALLQAALPATIELRQALADTVSTVMADPTQIHQVLLNLCTNAAHAMRDTGGVLTVGLDTCERVADRPAGALRLPPGPYVRLTVRDTGHGMTPAILERIFEPFFTTKDVGEGTGLGLAVVHGIIVNHGGTIRVDSTPGHGTTFAVYLPQSDRATAPVVSPEEAVPTGQECLLFVDDEAMLARLGQAALEHLGYEVVVCASGREALATFQVAPERFALVITDHTMPHMTGIDLAHALRRLRPALPIILCTGSSDLITAEKARALGIEAFCMKPLLLRDLGRLIRQVLEQRPAQEA